MLTFRHDVHTIRRRTLRYLFRSGCVLLVSVGTRRLNQAGGQNAGRPYGSWDEPLLQWQEP